MAHYRIVYIFFFSFFFSSCATLVEGTRERVDFTSYPSGATVSIDGREMGTTPFYTKLPVKRNYVVKFSQDTLHVTVPILRKIQLGYLIPEIIAAHTFYLSPFIIVDAISGAWFKLDKNYIHIDYTKQAINK